LSPVTSSTVVRQRPWSGFPGIPGRLSWSDPRTRAVVWQLLVVAMVCATIAIIANQTAANLKARGIASGFGYLSRATGFEISPGPLSYSSRDTYARALGVGLLNTLRVAFLGIVIATALGLLVGVARLSNIWLVSTGARAYVELLRNTPLLLQLLFWYALTQALPLPRNALNLLPSVYLCLRGLFLPALVWHDGYRWLGSAGLALVILVFLLGLSRYRRKRTGVGLSTRRILAGTAVVWLTAAIFAGLPVITLERPALVGFNFRGGMSISPEFAALLIGLSTYTAAFIGEIIRGGVLAVGQGQTEAAAALGLSRGRTLRLVILPQALRVIIPPTTSQFLNLAKNSSLAVAIGYPDLISVTNATLNQTGEAIEAITLAMILYLAISLAISVATNVYNGTAAPRVYGGLHP
jgi:general L-amino acid transport system permease protein